MEKLTKCYWKNTGIDMGLDWKSFGLIQWSKQLDRCWTLLETFMGQGIGGILTKEKDWTLILDPAWICVDLVLIKHIELILGCTLFIPIFCCFSIPVPCLLGEPSNSREELFGIGTENVTGR